MDRDRLSDDAAPATPQALRAELADCQQQLAQLQAAHEGFLRAVSHDLRAPLRHLTSFAPLLRESVEQLAAATPGEAAEEAQEFLGTMEQSARKMGRMLDALMQLSRAVRQPLDLQAVDACGVLQSCAARSLPLADTGAWELPAQPALLQADPAALHQVLSELLGNAAKFTARQAAPQVHVSLSMPVPRLWRLVIRDQGVGFESARMAPSWPPFQRMHRESDFDGVGCGLALVHALAQRHGATLQLHSHTGEGCTAVLEWPGAE
ncbi:MAG: ATP-binding protein [Comamonas sp.]